MLMEDQTETSGQVVVEQAGSPVEKSGNDQIVPVKKHKNPILAAVLSFFIAGLGQIYVGSWLGVMFFIMFFGSIIAANFSASSPLRNGFATLVWLAIALFIWVVSILDSIKGAVYVNRYGTTMPTLQQMKEYKESELRIIQSKVLRCSFCAESLTEATVNYCNSCGKPYCNSHISQPEHKCK